MVFVSKCTPPLKGLTNGFLQNYHVNGVVLQQMVNVVKVLHPGIDFRKGNHCLELFRNGGLDGISNDDGRFHFKYNGIGHLHGSRDYRIAKANVNLQPLFCPVQMGGDAYLKKMIIFLNRQVKHILEPVN